MSWAIWLAVPVAVTLLAAVWSWIRSRPPRLPDTAESMRAHAAYLDALGTSLGADGSPARGTTPPHAAGRD